MAALDTIQDFVSYLSKKEQLLRSGKMVCATGEEDLLPHYLTKMKDGEHNFTFPDDFAGVFIAEGEWEDFCKNPQRLAQLDRDKISYLWDAIIEEFNTHALGGTQYFVDPGGIESSDKVLRFFASTTRFERRLLATSLANLVASTPPDMCRRRVHYPLRKELPYFVFVAFPHFEEWTEAEYRKARAAYLRACCMAVRSIDVRAKDIVGYATESDASLEYRSEDSLYLDGRYWTEELQREAEGDRRQLELFIKPGFFRLRDSEFPDVPDGESP